MNSIKRRASYSYSASDFSDNDFSDSSGIENPVYHDNTFAPLFKKKPQKIVIVNNNVKQQIMPRPINIIAQKPMRAEKKIVPAQKKIIAAPIQIQIIPSQQTIPVRLPLPQNQVSPGIYYKKLLKNAAITLACATFLGGTIAATVLTAGMASPLLIFGIAAGLAGIYFLLKTLDSI